MKLTKRNFPFVAAETAIAVVMLRFAWDNWDKPWFVVGGYLGVAILASACALIILEGAPEVRRVKRDDD